jgi:histidinol-phosphate aminotransferase
MSLEEKVARLLRPEVRAIDAYHVQAAQGLVKLDAMENPYTWPEALQREWLQRLKEVPVNRYPDAAASQLKARLRDACGVPEGMELLLGNGSDEIIQILVMALARPGAVVLAPEPTFVMYRNLSLALDVDFVGVPLAENDFSLDAEAMLAAIGKHEPAVTFLARPNNPTGTLFDRDLVTRLIEASPGLVVVDEAYHPFAEDSFMEQLKDYDNLLIMRTLSKQGLAALRLGFLAGLPAWLREFDKLRLPYNINSLTQASVSFILEHSDVLDEQAARIRAERENLFQSLQELEGVTPWPSRSNFILLRTENRPGPEVFQGLKEEGVLVKNVHGADPLLDNCLRVTVSTPEENARFLAALKAVL